MPSDHPFQPERATGMSRDICVRCGLPQPMHHKEPEPVPQEFAQSRVYLKVTIRSTLTPEQISRRVAELLEMEERFRYRAVAIQQSARENEQGKTIDRYQIPCGCGKTFEARSIEGRCPQCSRPFRVAWKIQPPEVDKPKSITDEEGLE